MDFVLAMGETGNQDIRKLCVMPDRGPGNDGPGDEAGHLPVV